MLVSLKLKLAIRSYRPWSSIFITCGSRHSVSFMGLPACEMFSNSLFLTGESILSESCWSSVGPRADGQGQHLHRKLCLFLLSLCQEGERCKPIAVWVFRTWWSHQQHWKENRTLKNFSYTAELAIFYLWCNLRTQNVFFFWWKWIEDSFSEETCMKTYLNRQPKYLRIQLK